MPIAAQAVTPDTTVVTDNLHEFRRVPGLRLLARGRFDDRVLLA
jgi:predicted nucleic acid-binding protein